MVEGPVLVLPFPHRREHRPLPYFFKLYEADPQVETQLQGGGHDGHPQAGLHQLENGMGVHRFVGDARVETSVVIRPEGV